MMKELRALVGLLLIAPFAGAADWPQWLGPQRDGGSAEIVKPWQGPLKVLWTQPVGEGHGSPVVAGGKVYLHTRDAGKNAETLAAFDAKTGKPLWSTAYPRAAIINPFGTGPRATPCVVDGRVYTYGITGILSCFDAASGKQVWQVNALKKYQTPNLFFGASCSPLFVDGLVLINVGGKGHSIVAFDAKTGAERWKALDDNASYSSPIVLGTGKTQQVIVLTAAGVVSLRPSDGKLFWRHKLVDALAESSTTPVRSGDVLFASSITAGGVGLRLKTDDATPGIQELWKQPNLNCYFSTPVSIDAKYLYLVTGTKPPAFTSKATLRCVETATGKELWQRDKVGTYHASLLRTGDGKLLLLEEAGTLALLQPDPMRYRELCRSPICGNTWAHPALSDGRLYVRDRNRLVCVQMPE